MSNFNNLHQELKEMSDVNLRRMVNTNENMASVYALLNKKRPPKPRDPSIQTSSNFLKWWVSTYKPFKVKARTKPEKRRVDTEILPWLLVDTTSKSKRLDKTIEIPNARNNVKWSVNWRKNTNAIPVVNVKSSKGNQGKISSAVIGEYCKNTKNNIERESCRSGAVLNYKEKRLFRPMVRGPSISELKSKIIASQKDFNLAIDYVAMKRNGDYGQVKFVETLNDDPNAMAVKPGNRTVIDAFKNYLKDPNENLNSLISLIKKLKRQKSRLMFRNAVFWTNDRPAALYALKVGVPVVIRNKSKYYYVQKNTNIRNLPIENNIIRECIADDGVTKIAILDSMHDFIRAPKDIAIMTRIFRATIEGIENFLDMFINVASVKTAEAAIMEQVIEKVGKVLPDDEIVNIFGEGKELSGYGIVFDAGKMPNELRPKRIIGSVRISDPATADLASYNFIE